MWLKQLSVLNFKNYETATLAFSAQVNSFTGDNGAGKTNLLDAIHYLSLCKSYFNPIDSQQIKQELDWFMVQGTFDREATDDIVSCSVKRNQKKRFQRNKKEYGRLADHIGLFPLVMISPNDISLILEGSDERRKFIDNVISQTDNTYLDQLIAYNKYVQQRNSLLKQLGKYGKVDRELIAVLNEQMVLAGDQIFTRRKAFLDVFVPIFNQHYNFLSQAAETVGLVYESQLQQGDFSGLLEAAFDRDRLLERTTVGIHKDDLLFTVHDLPLKKFGSQGQQKSFLIALKLAQYSYLQQEKGFKPLLLLDDIFDKLDDKRTRKLMEMVSQDHFGQIFITHTHVDKLTSIFEEIRCPLRTFEIEKGNIVQVTDYEPQQR